jgi:hypothetical protein
MGSQIFQASESITFFPCILADARGLPLVESISKSSFNSLDVFRRKGDFTASSRDTRLIRSTLPAGWAGLHIVFEMIHNLTLGTVDSLIFI